MDAGKDQALGKSHQDSNTAIGLPFTKSDEERGQSAEDTRCKGAPEHDTLDSITLAQISAQELGDDISPKEAG